MKKYVFCFLGGHDIEVDKVGKFSNLKSIDEFTSRFNSEQELKKYLLSNFGTTYGYSWEMGKKLRIKCISEKSEYFLPIVYSYTKKYLSEDFVKSKFFYYTRDTSFLYGLASLYSTKFPRRCWKDKSPYTHKLYFCLEEIKAMGGFFASQELNGLLREVLEQIYLRAVSSGPNGGNDYNGTRILGFFIYDFESRRESKERTQRIENLKSFKDEVNKSKAPNENEDEYYQLTFGDIIR